MRQRVPSQFLACTLCLLSVLPMLSCGSHRGEKIIVRYHDGGTISRAEFADLFAESKLMTFGGWYYGDCRGFHMLALDRRDSIDGYDDVFNRRVRHDVYRYRVLTNDVTFSKTVAFTGYDHGLRMVPEPADDDDHTVHYKVRNDGSF